MAMNSFASSTIRIALCVLLCTSATACDISPPSIGNFGACTSGPYAVFSIGFVPADTLRVRVGEQESLQVKALDVAGDSGEFCGPSVTTSSASPEIATAAGSGRGIVRVNIRGVAPGRTVLRASSGGRSDSLTIIVSQ